jgi:hypothetical protein
MLPYKGKPDTADLCTYNVQLNQGMLDGAVVGVYIPLLWQPNLHQILHLKDNIGGLLQ